MIIHYKSILYICLLALIGLFHSGCDQNEWIALFDGSTLEGWEASENKDSWRVENGTLVANGPRSHLFYVGQNSNTTFKNFILEVDVKTESLSNSGIYFHTQYQETGWPDDGYEAQIANNIKRDDSGAYTGFVMTGSLNGIRNVLNSPVEDEKWFHYRILVKGKTIRTYINGQLIVDYTEPDDPFRPEATQGRVLSSGTFALQSHSAASKVYFKNIKVKPLSDDIETPGQPLADQDFAERLIRLNTEGIPLADLHAHLKDGLTMEQALANARKYGFTYGIPYNSGIKMGIETEDSLRSFIAHHQQPAHTYMAMQAEGREWVNLFEKETVSRFDYIITDAMTWTNDNGQRMRLWIEEETFVGEPQHFMGQLVDRIENILNNEPIDIYVNATYLPKEIAARYDELWTQDRMDRVINALVKNSVAMEISARYKIPGGKFIERAKKAGVKFTFGTNNTGPDDLGRLEYCLNMVEKVQLTTTDFWLPK